MKVLIIGGVAGGAAAATRLKREDNSVEVTVLEKSSKVSFSNCGLPYGISGEVALEKLAPSDTSFLESKGINVFVNTEAVSIDEENKIVKAINSKTNENMEFKFDKLIVSTGARAMKLPIEGIEEEKTYSLRTFDDLEKIKEKIADAKDILIIGGGFIGVEIAEVLINANKNVHLVEIREKLAGFDYDFSSFLEEELRINGVNLHLGAPVSKIDSSNKKFIVKDIEYKYDFIITTGISPNTEIFNNTSVKLDERNIVITDKYKQTSNKDIYAVGDITYTKDIVTGKDTYSPMAKQAKTQGRVAVDHILGIKTEGAHDSSGASGFELFKKEYGKTGLSEAASKNAGIDTRIVMATSSSNANYVGSTKLVMKMIFNNKDNKLVGLQAFGKHAWKAVDAFTVALTAKMDIYDLERLNLLYQPHISTTLNPLNIIAQVAVNENRIGFTSECPMHIVVHEPEVKIIDIRTEDQHSKSHIDGAINIPTDKLSIESVGEDLNQKIAVHCNSGFGASIAARKLVELGYKNVRNLSGGNNAFQLMKKK